VTGFGPRAVLLSVAAYTALAAACAGAAALWPAAAGLPLGADALRDAVVGAVAGLLIVAGSWVFSTRTRAGRRLAADLGRMLDGIPAWGVPVMALAAGVAEEALFRGTLWSLAEGVAGPAAALATTSILFAGAHGLFSHRLRTWGLFALVTGLFIGLLRDRTGGLIGPVVAHVVIDAVNVPVVVKLSRRREGP
jgi:membrane protease YdiL (CAAX protease family)